MKNISLLLFFLLFCCTTLPAQSQSGNPFLVPVKNRDFDKNPKLLERILSSPHGYFRFINIPFSQYICRQFQETYFDAPIFNLHGDAHIEQYAVTDLGRGMTDFDDSATGPAILDLMRFSVSVYLACRELGWPQQADAIVENFFKGYTNALTNPGLVFPEPAIVSEIRSRFTYDSLAYFKWIDSVMEPIPAEELSRLETASRLYKDAMYQQNPQLPADYFNLEAAGYLHMGIGSALDKKYLLRCNGATANPYDDVVLEVKEVRDISAIECLNTSQKNDPFRILVGQSRISYQPFHHLGYFQFEGVTYWVHSWVQNYKELTILKSYHNVDDMMAVAYDIGVQLGLGHPKLIAAPLDYQLRQAQIRWLKLYDLKIRRQAKKLAGDVIEAWQQFRQKFNKNSKPR